MFRKEKSKKGVFWAALLGIIAGGATALLLAPKSGKKLRRDLVNKCQETAEKTKEILDRVEEEADDLVDRAKTIAKNAKEASGSWFNVNGSRK